MMDKRSKRIASPVEFFSKEKSVYNSLKKIISSSNSEFSTQIVSKNYERALSVSRKQASSHKNDRATRSSTAFNIAFIYFKLNQRRRAKRYLRSAISLGFPINKIFDLADYFKDRKQDSYATSCYYVIRDYYYPKNNKLLNNDWGHLRNFLKACSEISKETCSFMNYSEINSNFIANSSSK